VFSALCEHSVVDCVLVVHRVAHSVSVALNVSVGLSVSVADSEDAVVKCVCTNVCVSMSVYRVLTQHSARVCTNVCLPMCVYRVLTALSEHLLLGGYD